MIENPLIHLLSTFSRKEMTRFNEFGHSPYHNKHDEVRALVGLFNDAYPDFSTSVDRYQLFKQLYPGQDHDQSKLALIFTYTMRLADQFLIQEQLKGQEEELPIFLLRQLRQRKQFKYYERNIKKLDRTLQSLKLRDSDFYRLQYLKASEADNYYSQLNKREQDLNIQRKQDNLDNYYLSVKLRDACEMLLRARILKVEYSTGWLDTILKEVEQHLDFYTDVPSILVYYYIYQLILHEEDNRYREILPIVKKYAHQFKRTELQNIYNYLLNHCIRQVNKGSKYYLREAFELFKIQLDQKLLLDEEEYLAEHHYKNIVTIGLRLKEVRWIKNFIEQYKTKLPPATQGNAYQYNLAAYYYAVQNYDQVLELLLTVEYTDLWYNLDSKSLVLRTYYDLDEYEAFLSLQKSFKQLIRRNKLISDFQRLGYHNLLRFMNKAFKVKSEVGYRSDDKIKESVKELIQEITATTPIHNKGWLEGRIGNII